jgi:3,2-trans-enoyl-CoA isomerase
MAAVFHHTEFAVEDGIAILTMARGKVNALNQDMVDEMLHALDAASEDPSVRALILASNRPGFFSAGFDIKEVFLYDRLRMTAHLRSYGALIHKLHHFPKPTIAAINGHNFAGGAILSLACDFRVMAQGEFGFAVNEIKVGVVIPPAIFKLCADVVGAKNAHHMILTGDPVSSARALEIGLVDELAAPEEVLERARQMAIRVAKTPPATFAAVKAVIREATGHSAEHGGFALAPPVEPWFTPEAEARKKAMLEGLSKPKGV